MYVEVRYIDAENYYKIVASYGLVKISILYYSWLSYRRELLIIASYLIENFDRDQDQALYDYDHREANFEYNQDILWWVLL